MKNYVKPIMEVETFRANEYLTSCQDNFKYLFECNAGKGYPAVGGDDDNPAGLGSVWLETNGVPGLQTEKNGKIKKDKYLSKYYPCGTTHEADSKDPFLTGYYISDYTGKVEDVIVWRGPKGDNTHCTTELNMKNWGRNHS